jgi:hypothetical protein
MIIIQIDKEMMLTELYELRAAVTDIMVESDETAAARKKIDQIIALVHNAPQCGGDSSLPRISVRGSQR